MVWCFNLGFLKDHIHKVLAQFFELNQIKRNLDEAITKCHFDNVYTFSKMLILTKNGSTTGFSIESEATQLGT